MLKRLYVDNFKCLDDFEIAFDGHALLMGANGSGKSTVVEVLERLRRFLVGGEKAGDCFPPSTRTRWRDEARQTFKLEIEWQGSVLSWDVSLVHADDETAPVSVASERVVWNGVVVLRRDDPRTAALQSDLKTAAATVLIPEELSAMPLVSRSSPESAFPWLVGQAVDSVIPLRLEPSGMSSRAGRPARMLDWRATNLAAWFLHLSETSSDQLARITARAREVLPALHQFRFRAEGDTQRLLTDWRTLPAGQEEAIRTFAFDELSDGQRVVILLSAVVDGLPPLFPATLVLDEPDNFIALNELQPLMLAMTDRPNVQLIVVSHHPELIDLFAKHHGYYFWREDGLGKVRWKRWRAPEDSMLTASELVARGDLDGGA